MGGLDKQSEPASVGGDQVDTFCELLYEVLQEFHQRVLHNEDYPYSTLGLAEWLEFERLKTVSDLASNNPEASAELSNPPKESL